jgi:hypothetical protein
MRLYVKFQFSSEGRNPLEIVKVMQELGFTPEVGDYDFSIPFRTPEQYAEILEEVKNRLKNTDVLYTLTTKER